MTPEELNKKEQLLNASDFNFLSNNVKGLQSFKFFKNKVSRKSILFLQETHSLRLTENIWSDEINGDLFFRMGKQILLVF